MRQDKYMLAHIFEEHHTGNTFEKWPLHVTIVPWFTLDQNPKESVIESLDSITKEHLPIPITIGEPVMLGPNKDEPAYLIESSDSSLENYHRKILQALGELGCKVLDTAYVDENYVPHTSTNVPPPLVRSGLINDVTLMQKLPEEMYIASILMP